MRLAVAMAIAALFATACNKGPATVDGIRLAQARGVYDPPPAKAKLTVTSDLIPDDDAVAKIVATVDKGAAIRLIVAMDVPWHEVRRIVDAVIAAGRKPVILIGKRSHLAALHLSDKLSGGPAIQLVAQLDGKICLAPPETKTAKCVTRYLDDHHIDRAFTRGLVDEGVKAYNLHDVELHIPPMMDWADVVRALDGARTCCGDTEVRVEILRPDETPRPPGGQP